MFICLPETGTKAATTIVRVVNFTAFLGSGPKSELEFDSRESSMVGFLIHSLADGGPINIVEGRFSP